MKRIEDILDSAIKRAQSGEEISQIVLSAPESERKELQEFLETALQIMSIKTSDVPEPKMRRLYLDADPVFNRGGFFSVFQSRIKTYAIALTALVLFATGFTYAVANSLPGDALFKVKKAYEVARLDLTTSPASRAKLELAFADSRLRDAEKVLQQSNDQTVRDQAIAEMNSQTATALNNIKQVASSSSISGDSSIINQIQNLTQSQAKIVAKADPKNAAQITQSSDKTVAEIQKLITASNEQDSANIPATKNIDISGKVVSIQNEQITVDSNNYIIDPKAIIQNDVGSSVQIGGISVGDTVKIQGITQDNQNIAKTITLITKVKAVQKAPAATVKTDAAADSNQQNPASQISNPPTKPQDTFGTFIPEPANLPDNSASN